MKRYMLIILSSICLFCLIGCSDKQEDILHLGLNAEITEIDAENHILFISRADENSNEAFGGSCAIDLQQSC